MTTKTLSEIIKEQVNNVEFLSETARITKFIDLFN